MYRVSDTDFTAYVQQLNQTLGELDGIAVRGVDHFRYLAQILGEADISERWSTSIGLARWTLTAGSFRRFRGLRRCLTTWKTG
jgi:hypothetical protein